MIHDPERVIDTVLDCLQSLNNNDEKPLEQLIPDTTYRQNSIQLAKKLAPDGDRVKVVGFTVVRHGSERKVFLGKQTPHERTAVDSDVQEPAKPTRIKGRLLFASSTSKRKKIKIVEPDGTSHNVVVPAGMMADVIVRPLWEEDVEVTGFYRGETFYLDDIRAAEHLDDNDGDE